MLQERNNRHRFKCCHVVRDPPGAFSSRTGIFQTSGSKDRSSVSSSSRQVSSCECSKTQRCYLERFPLDHMNVTPRHSHQTSICPALQKYPPPHFTGKRFLFWICLISLVLFIYKLTTNNRHFIISSMKKNQLADLFDISSPYYRKSLVTVSYTGHRRSILYYRAQ